MDTCVNTLYFKSWSLDARIGILPHEIQAPQVIIIDLECNFDISSAAAHDDIAYAIDYREIKECIYNIVHARHYNLIENLAHTIATAVLQQFAIHSIRLSISKPDIFSDMQAVGITIERSGHRDG